MNRLFPALDICWAIRPNEEVIERLLAAIDDSAPTAVADQPGGVRVFFSTTMDRDRGLAAARVWDRSAASTAVEVPDDAWAERSQAAIRAVRVGRLIIAPPWDPIARSRDGQPSGSSEPARDASPEASTVPPADIVIVIQPSMGFGTGHHASTRLCLHLLQHDSIAGASVLDVGTGSGVLAIAAWRLGAREALGIDSDPDAVASAQENVEQNGAVHAVELRTIDFTGHAPALARHFDLVTANLTGAMLERHATALAAAVAHDGRLVASGFQTDEEAAVADALRAAGLTVRTRAAEDGWVAVSCQRMITNPTTSTARSGLR